MQLSSRAPLINLYSWAPSHAPFILIPGAHSFSLALEKLGQIQPSQRYRSIITGRRTPDLSPFLHEQEHVWLIPDCDSFIFSEWINLISGTQKLRVFPQYFFTTPEWWKHSKELNKWTKVFSELTAEDFMKQETVKWFNISWLDKRLGLYGNKLLEESKKLFGHSPGYILRVCRTFIVTAACIQNEKDPSSSTGSYLKYAPGDYRRALKKITGSCYAKDLLAQIQKEHWVICWMRAWQKTMLDKKS